MSAPLSRRAAVRRVVLLGLSATALEVSASCSDADSTDTTPEWLLAGFSEADLAALGAAYTAATPSEASDTALAAALHDALKPWPWSATRPLRELVAADFTAGETVLLNGWLLSRTEARCCALLASKG